MKKNNFLLMLVAIAVTTLFASCSKSSDSNSDGNTGSATTLTTGSAAYQYVFNKTALDIYNVTIKYYDATGNVKTVDVSSLTDKSYTYLTKTVVCKVWNQSITYPSITSGNSYKCGFKVVFTRKDGVIPTNDFDLLYAKGCKVSIDKVKTKNDLLENPTLSGYQGVNPTCVDDIGNIINKLSVYQYTLFTTNIADATLDFQ